MTGNYEKLWRITENHGVALGDTFKVGVKRVI